MVSEEENDELMKPFSEQEIIDVIWSMELDKAQVLMVFPSIFIEFVGQ